MVVQISSKTQQKI